MKKNKYFYSQIVDITSITIEIGNMEMEKEERLHLLSLAESSIHHAIIDKVLSELNENDKRKFIEHLHSDNHDEIWKLLNEKIQNAENKIIKAAEDIKKALQKDIKELQ